MRDRRLFHQLVLEGELVVVAAVAAVLEPPVEEPVVEQLVLVATAEELQQAVEYFLEPGEERPAELVSAREQLEPERALLVEQELEREQLLQEQLLAHLVYPFPRNLKCML